MWKEGRLPTPSDLKFSARFTQEGLKQFRQIGDPIADNCVNELSKDGLGNIHDLLGVVKARAENGEEVFMQFMEEQNGHPEWIDLNLANEGASVLATYLFVMFNSLLCGSLVGGVMFKQQALITAEAGSFSANPARRVDETGTMISQLVFRNGLKVGNNAHQTMSRIRLLHAGLRKYLNMQNHNREEVPINQEDLAITLCLFCYCNIRSLFRMGVYLFRREVDAFVHLWRVAGFYLGIRTDLLPVTIEDQEEFYLAAMVDEADGDWELTKPALLVLDSVSEKTFFFLPRCISRTYLYQMTQYLNGEWVKGMEIEETGPNHWTKWLCWFFANTTSITSNFVPFGSDILENLNKIMLSVMLSRKKQPKGMAFGVRSKL